MKTSKLLDMYPRGHREHPTVTSHRVLRVKGRGSKQKITSKPKR